MGDDGAVAGGLSMIIRPYETTDLSELTALLRRAYAQHAEKGLAYGGTRQNEVATARRIAAGTCYVAEQDGRLVGTILLKAPGQSRGTPWYNHPKVATFEQFAVDATLQRRGLGSALLDFVEGKARELGATEMGMDTADRAEHLIAMYTERGYRVVGYTYWIDTNYRSIVMSQPLQSGQRVTVSRFAMWCSQYARYVLLRMPVISTLFRAVWFWTHPPANAQPQVNAGV